MVGKTASEDRETQFPLAYDHDIYVNHPRSSDLAAFTRERAHRHYLNFGLEEGRVCSKVKSRKDFIGLIPSKQPILEIGPFFSPAFKRPTSDVHYLDCLSTEAMKKRAEKIKGADLDGIPHIDYVWSGQPYADLIERKFKAIYSSHNIEHQPCLITHLHDLESVLDEEGAVFLAVPDKRYCFDHYFHETTLTDVVEAWVMNRKQNRLKDILDHRFFPAHNDPVRHWRGDHGANTGLTPLNKGQGAVFLSELEQLRSSNEYNDVHVWKFTPVVFKVLFENLFNLKLTRLRIVRIYPTVKNSNEFYVVMMLG